MSFWGVVHPYCLQWSVFPDQEEGRGSAGFWVVVALWGSALSKRLHNLLPERAGQTPSSQLWQRKPGLSGVKEGFRDPIRQQEVPLFPPVSPPGGPGHEGVEEVS